MNAVAAVGLLVLTAWILNGCTTLTAFEGRAEAAFEAGVNPEEREIHYIREGNVVHYFRRECTGKFCETR